MSARLYLTSEEGGGRKLPLKEYLAYLETCAQRWEREPNGSGEAKRVRARVERLLKGVPEP